MISVRPPHSSRQESFSGDLFRATSFKLALTYLSIFAVSAGVLVGFVSWSAKHFIERQIQEVVEAEAGGLAERYRERGIPGLSELVAERLRQDNDHRSVYLLLAPDGMRMAGNLYGWPARALSADGWVRFTAERIGEHGPAGEVLAHAYSLTEGFDLLVGRSLGESGRVVSAINRALGWGLALTVLLGVAGGILSSRQLLQRVDAMSKTARSIINGDIKSRMKLSGARDEFDRLGQSFNEMMDEIERLLEGIRTVSDNIAHDLRTPLNRLRSRIDLALMKSTDTNALREVLEQSLVDADHLLGTFNALLAISEVETGDRSRHFITLDPAQLAEDVAELYEPLAEDKEIKMIVSLEQGMTLSGDPHLLFQALANILDNAVKYTPRGGGITLTVTRVEAEGETPAQALIVVADSGPGIPEADNERVMERFVRLDSTRSTPGNGLGLSMVRAVAQVHDADLRLESNEPGLKVCLSLPIV